jgi:RNA polymerase sigma-70 factor (ECF subfamily)
MGVIVLTQALTPDAKVAHQRDTFARLRAGDPTALREIFRMHSRAAYWAALSVLRSQSDAEEITQDTFLTLWDKRDTVVITGGSMLPWIVTTSRFLALNRSRHRSVRAEVPLADEFELQDPAVGPHEAAEAAEARSNLDRIVAAMPAIDQQIFNLCLLEDLSYDQAARRLGVTVGSVRNRLSRLRLRLQSELTIMKGERL